MLEKEYFLITSFPQDFLIKTHKKEDSIVIDPKT